jgi:hypothetical protein
MPMWTCNRISGHAMTARTAEPRADTVLRALKKWWVAATMRPTTIQTTPPSETCRVLTTAETVARMSRSVKVITDASNPRSPPERGRKRHP